MAKSLVEEYNKKELDKIIKDSYCYKDALFKIGYKCLTGNQSNALKNKIKEYNIDTSHFTKTIPRKRKDDEIFIINSPVTQSVLKRRYKNNNYSEYKCKVCGQESNWNNRPLTLTLDHINGNNKDNRLENLRWVCPNCDRQLNTFAGKNSKKLKKEKNCCKVCGKQISNDGYLCKECSFINRRKVHRPSREELKVLLKEKSFVEIGILYSVSDNTIKKWCDSYCLPRLRREIDNFTYDDWVKI